MDCGGSRTLARIDPNHHAVQEQRNVGRAYLIDKALRVLGTGELLLKVRKAKTGVDALAEDSAQVLLALHDGHACACLMRGHRGRHAGRSAADNDHVEGLRCYRRCGSGLRAFIAHIKSRHASAPPSAVPQPTKIRHPPTAPRWDRSLARVLGSPPRGSGKSRSGIDPCRHDSGA